MVDSLGVAHTVLKITDKALGNSKENSSFQWVGGFFASGNTMFVMEAETSSTVKYQSL